MSRLLTFILLGVVLFVTACSKDNGNNESIFYGNWVNQTNTGDTLQFKKMNNKSILHYNASLNQASPAFEDREFNYKKGKLFIALSATSTPDYEISSFTWVEYANEFDVEGHQLFQFMSSLTHFRYKRIN